MEVQFPYFSRESTVEHKQSSSCWERLDSPPRKKLTAAEEPLTQHVVGCFLNKHLLNVAINNNKNSQVSFFKRSREQSVAFQPRVKGAIKTLLAKSIAGTSCQSRGGRHFPAQTALLWLECFYKGMANPVIK